MIHNEIQAQFEKYAAAWNARQIDAIIALHAPDTVFRLRLGAEPHRGHDEVARAFADLLHQWPQLTVTVRDVRFGPDHWVLDWTLSAVLGEDGAQREVAFDCLDLVTLTSDGLVDTKDTFVDYVQLQTALNAA